MSNSNQAGKGDKPRPVDKKQYNTNFENIKWKSEEPKESKTRKGKTTYKY